MSHTSSFGSAKAVYECAGEIYHLDRARTEYGDEAVLASLARRYRQAEQLSVADAAIRAGRFLNDMDDLKQHRFDFHGMREELAEAKRGGEMPAGGILAL